MAAMDLNESIRSAVPWIVTNYGFNADSCTQSKKVLNDLISETEGKELAAQRIYLMYYLIETLSKLKEEETRTFFARLLPMPLKKNISTFLTHLVSLAVCLENKQILTVASLYIEREQLKLPEDIEYLPEHLAETSPRFAAILIDKGYFNTVKEVFSPHLLTCWLKILNRSESQTSITFNGQSLVRYSLFGPGQNDAELYFRVLEAIERRLLVSLSSQFITDLATNVSHHDEGFEKDNLIGRFCQLLIVAIQVGVITKFPNQVKTTLTTLFPDNSLIKTIISIKSK